jgi:hypothetical protein
LSGETADSIEAKTFGEASELAQLRQVLHQVTDASLGLFGVGHAVSPERLPSAVLLIPLGHANARWEPCQQVVMDYGFTGALKALRLDFRYPRVPAGDRNGFAPRAKTIDSFRDVVCSPLVRECVCEGDKPADGRPETLFCNAVEMA